MLFVVHCAIQTVVGSVVFVLRVAIADTTSDRSLPLQQLLQDHSIQRALSQGFVTAALVLVVMTCRANRSLTHLI